MRACPWTQMEEAGSNEHPAKKQRVETGGDGDGMEVSAAAPSAPPPAALSPEEKLLRQLEYYFSDAAFPFDNFLLEQRDADGAISAATLASFPKVVALTASLSQTAREQALCNAAAASDSVYALDGGRIARRFPLPGEDPTAARSVCLEGMPRATDQTAVEALLRDAGADPLPPVAQRARPQLFRPILCRARERRAGGCYGGRGEGREADPR